LRNVVFSFGVVDDLGLNGDVLDSLVGPLDGLLDHNGLLDFSSDVLNLSLNSVVVGDGSLVGNSLVPDDLFVFDFLVFDGHLVDLLDLLVFNVFLLEGDVFDSAFDGDIGSSDSLTFSSVLGSDLTFPSDLTFSVVGLPTGGVLRDS
jgi:hypothetical protein